jgi:hypothetical protein
MRVEIASIGCSWLPPQPWTTETADHGRGHRRAGTREGDGCACPRGGGEETATGHNGHPGLLSGTADTCRQGRRHIDAQGVGTPSCLRKRPFANLRHEPITNELRARRTSSGRDNPSVKHSPLGHIFRRATLSSCHRDERSRGPDETAPTAALLRMRSSTPERNQITTMRARSVNFQSIE